MEHRSRSRDEFPWVGIIILNWRGLHHTLACLKSLDNVTYPHKRVIVVENGSGDRSAEEIRAAFPSVIVLEQHENYGFAKGNNIGIDYAKSQGMDYVLLLNNDVEVEPGFLNLLVGELERQENAGIAGPTIYYFDQPDILWSAGGGVDWKKGNTYMIGDGQRDQGQFGALAREVEWITGCALLIKMEVIHSVGGLDERFFAYYEETEFCIRARRAGWTILHVPPARIWHKISLAAREASPQVNYYMTRNRLLFLKLVKAGIAAMIYTLILEFGFRYVNWFINPKWRSKRQQRYALLRGVLDYCRGKFGKMDIQESSVSV
jgi:GT2 family glycosyltransferase